MSKDFSNLVKSFITAFFWLSGILWNINSLHDLPWLQKLLMLNPVTYLVEGYRNCFINETWFWQQPKRLLYFAIILGIMMLISIWTYRRLRKEIPDVLN